MEGKTKPNVKKKRKKSGDACPVTASQKRNRAGPTPRKKGKKNEKKN